MLEFCLAEDALAAEGVFEGVDAFLGYEPAMRDSEGSKKTDFSGSQGQEKRRNLT